MDDDTLFGNWWASDVRKIIIGQPEITVANIAFRAGVKSAQQSVHLTALWRWLAASLFINVVLLAVVLAIIGGG